MWARGIPLRALVPFLGRKYLETKIWDLGVLFLHLMFFALLLWQGTGEMSHTGLGLASLNNFCGLWEIEAVVSCLIPGPG